MTKTTLAEIPRAKSDTYEQLFFKVRNLEGRCFKYQEATNQLRDTLDHALALFATVQAMAGEEPVTNAMIERFPKDEQETLNALRAKCQPQNPEVIAPQPQASTPTTPAPDVTLTESSPAST